MMTEAAVHPPPWEKIYRQVRADDFSVLAFNWCQFETGAGQGEFHRVPPASNGGSRGVASGLAGWAAALEGWLERFHQETRSKEKFVPTTALGGKLWALRQKYIAEGGRLYSLHEIQQEVSRRRDESD
jgi:hypothetical protein